MLVRAKEAFYSTVGNPAGTLITPADVLRDDNAHVKAYPDRFAPIEDDGRANDVTGVETATARPGEKRAR